MEYGVMEELDLVCLEALRLAMYFYQQKPDSTAEDILKAAELFHRFVCDKEDD